MELQSPKMLRTAKAGNRPDQCEDACRAAYPFVLGVGGRAAARIALSDGASEAAFARLWAQILVNDFVARPPVAEGPDPGYLQGWLAPCQEAWNQSIHWDRIPWHGEAKTRAGSLATFLGLKITRPPGSRRDLKWQALAVGDSCLFVVRQDELKVSFPLDDAGQFNNAPFLLCSNPAGNRRVWESVRQVGGSCRPGDVFILASDALACWFLAKKADGEKPWETLLTLDSSGWDSWVGDQRQGGLMGNDDTTLVIFKVI